MLACKGLGGACLLQVGSEFAISTIEQQLQIKALRTLNACLTALTVDAPQKFEGAPLACCLFAHSSTAATVLIVLTQGCV